MTCLKKSVTRSQQTVTAPFTNWKIYPRFTAWYKITLVRLIVFLLKCVYIWDLPYSETLRRICSWLAAFRENISVSASSVKQFNSSRLDWFLKTERRGCLETSVTTNLRCVKSQQNEDIIHNTAETWKSCMLRASVRLYVSQASSD